MFTIENLIRNAASRTASIEIRPGWRVFDPMSERRNFLISWISAEGDVCANWRIPVKEIGGDLSPYVKEEWATREPW